MTPPNAEIPIRDLVPDEMRSGNEYDVIRGNMERNLARPDKVERYATHESGHLIYLIKTGLISQPKDAVFAGPTIYLEDGEVRQFSAAVTSNRIRLTDETLEYTEAILEKAALASAAASEFEKELLGADEDTEKAETGDKGTLFKHCHKAKRRNGIEFQAYTLWPFAQCQTRAWLQENRSECAKLVSISNQVVFSRCFGSRVDLLKADFSIHLPHEVATLLLQLLFE